jgi:hypothetical protein
MKLCDFSSYLLIIKKIENEDAVIAKLRRNKTFLINIF